MNSYIVVVAACLAVAHGGVIAHTGLVSHTIIAPAVKSTLLQGPSTSSHIVGPDGSQIIANAPGGTVQTAEHVGVASEVISPAVAYSAPVVSAPVVATAPVVAASPVVAAAEIVARSAAIVQQSGQVVGPVVPQQAAIVAQQAGIVAHATPIVSHSAPLIAHGSPALTYAAPIVANVFPRGSGIEGQYIPDINEKLFDNGLYKGEIY